MEGSSAELSLRAARWIKADTFAEDLLAAIADEERGGEIGEWARTIREKLGPDLVARIARTQVRVRG